MKGKVRINWAWVADRTRARLCTATKIIVIAWQTNASASPSPSSKSSSNVKDFYTAYYTAVEHSRAHHLFCERVYGHDLSQHGFADKAQLDLLLQVTRLSVGQRALDIGCGNGLIAEYMSDASGAHVTGLDYIASAIEFARQRTAAKAERLNFVVGDINALLLPAHAFDVAFSIDTIYFSNDYAATVAALVQSLRPHGQLVFLYSYGREPWVPADAFPVAALAPDATPLAKALQANGLAFRTWDLTQDDLRLAKCRQHVLTELKPLFEAEGNAFICDNRMGDANGVRQAIEQGLHKRYLYHVRLDVGGGA